jgi:Protein of unknown function (DUF3592)
LPHNEANKNPPFGEQTMNNPVVFGAIFLVIGLILLVIGILQRNQAQEAQSWPITSGVIIGSGLLEHKHFDAEDHHTEITYEPQVQYQFSVNGQAFAGNRIAFGTVSYPYQTAANKIASYPQGTSVTVHYDPDDPNQSVLEPKAAGGVILLIMGILFIIVGLVVGFGKLLVK